jgi:hypothetical protein
MWEETEESWRDFFPSVESYLRLFICYLLESTEDWANDYAYIKADKPGPILEQEQILAAN